MSLTVGLLAGWRLDEDAGQPRADVLGVATLVETGGTVLSAAGKIGNAANFAADNHCLKYSSALFTKGSLTMACWVNWTSAGASGTVLLGQGLLSGVASQILGLLPSSGALRYAVNGTAASDGLLLPGIWTHTAMVYDATGNNGAGAYATYQNGVQINVRNVAANFAGAGAVAVGNNPSGSAAGTANALVQQAYIWNRALSNAEVARLYAAGNAGLSYPWTDGRGF